jgi:hypothetical protein
MVTSGRTAVLPPARFPGTDRVTMLPEAVTVTAPEPNALPPEYEAETKVEPAGIANLTVSDFR